MTMRESKAVLASEAGQVALRLRRSITILFGFAARSLRLSNHVAEFAAAESYGRHRTRGEIPAGREIQTAEDAMPLSRTLDERPSVRKRVEKLKRDIATDAERLRFLRSKRLLPRIPSTHDSDAHLKEVGVSKGIRDISAATARHIDRKEIAKKLGTPVAGTRPKTTR